MPRPYIFVTILLVALALLTLGHIAVYRALVSIFGITEHRKLVALRVLLAVMSGGFVASMFLAARYYNVFTRFFYTLTASWMGVMHYVLIACVIYAVLALASRYLYPGAPVATIGKLLIAVALLTASYGIINAERIKVREITVSIPALPDSWQGRRAVLVSDTHFGQVRGPAFSRKVVRYVNAANPDVVFFPGDFFDGTETDIEGAVAPWRGITAPLGTYFAMGNHEEFSDPTKYKDALDSAGIKTLVDRMEAVDGVQIIGADYRGNTDESRFKDMLASLRIDRAMPALLLKHEPAGIIEARDAGVSFMLSGHTHRAQMWPLGYVPRMIYGPFDYGLKSSGDMQVFTTSGVGTWGPPLRVGTDAEIVVITFAKG